MNPSNQVAEINTISAFAQSLSAYDVYQKWRRRLGLRRREEVNRQIAGVQKKVLKWKDLVRALVWSEW